MPDVLLPKWGVSMREGTIVRWHLNVGDHVQAGDPLAEIVTDKVDVSLESPHTGQITEIFVLENETVPVGTRLASIE